MNMIYRICRTQNTTPVTMWCPTLVSLAPTMPWPVYVLRQFTGLPASASQRDIRGPYNSLLHTLFPPNSGFTVAQRWPRAGTNSLEPMDLMFLYEILLYDARKPVLVLQLKAPWELQRASHRTLRFELT